MSGLARRISEIPELQRSENKWDRRFLEMAELVSTWSKDPSTKVGAVIVDPRNRVVSVGFNGLPRRVVDSPDRYSNREHKYSMIVHGDLNAILFAGRDLTGCTIYTVPFIVCDRCAGPVIQSGITRVVSVRESDYVAQRWADSIAKSMTMLFEAGVRCAIY